MSLDVQPAIHRLTHEGSLVISVFSGPSTASPRVLFPTARYLQEETNKLLHSVFCDSPKQVKIFQEKKLLAINPLFAFTTAF